MFIDMQNIFTGGTAIPGDTTNTNTIAQSLAQVVGTYYSTNSIDMGLPGTDANANSVRHDLSQSMAFVDARIVATFASAGAATLQVQIINDTNANLTTAPVIVDSTQVLSLATLVVGYKFRFTLASSPLANQFLGLKFIIAGATTTAGLVVASLQPTNHP